MAAASFEHEGGARAALHAIVGRPGDLGGSDSWEARLTTLG